MKPNLFALALVAVSAIPHSALAFEMPETLRNLKFGLAERMCDSRATFCSYTRSPVQSQLDSGLKRTRDGLLEDHSGDYGRLYNEGIRVGQLMGKITGIDTMTDSQRRDLYLSFDDADWGYLFGLKQPKGKSYQTYRQNGILAVEGLFGAKATEAVSRQLPPLAAAQKEQALKILSHLAYPCLLCATQEAVDHGNASMLERFRHMSKAERMMEYVDLMARPNYAIAWDPATRTGTPRQPTAEERKLDQQLVDTLETIVTESKDDGGSAQALELLNRFNTERHAYWRKLEAISDQMRKGPMWSDSMTSSETRKPSAGSARE